MAEIEDPMQELLAQWKTQKSIVVKPVKSSQKKKLNTIIRSTRKPSIEVRTNILTENRLMNLKAKQENEIKAQKERMRYFYPISNKRNKSFSLIGTTMNVNNSCLKEGQPPNSRLMKQNSSSRVKNCRVNNSIACEARKSHLSFKLSCGNPKNEGSILSCEEKTETQPKGKRRSDRNVASPSPMKNSKPESRTVNFITPVKDTPRSSSHSSTKSNVSTPMFHTPVNGGQTRTPFRELNGLQNTSFDTPASSVIKFCLQFDTPVTNSIIKQRYSLLKTPNIATTPAKTPASKLRRMSVVTPVRRSMRVATSCTKLPKILQEPETTQLHDDLDEIPAHIKGDLVFRSNKALDTFSGYASPEF